jgi:hypothetical protein
MTQIDDVGLQEAIDSFDSIDLENMLKVVEEICVSVEEGVDKEYLPESFVEQTKELRTLVELLRSDDETNL